MAAVARKMTNHLDTTPDFYGSADISAIQAQAWDKQIDYVSSGSAYFRRLWQGRKLPKSLAGLQDLPFSDKASLRENQASFPPFGDYLCAKPEAVIRLHRTSGTTGRSMNIALSAADAELTAKVGARAHIASGLRPRDLVVHCLNYQMWIGGFTDHAILEATGATVIPFGVGDSAKLVRTIQELKIDAISCTPSYPAVLERTIEDEFPGLDPRALGLKLALMGGETGLDARQFRARLEDRWGFAVRNSNYGVSDVLCNFSGQCEHQNDLHYVGSDAVYPELIDPDTGDTKPWRAGEQGELVLTHLAKECQPLVRFRTGDVWLITGTDRCSCGRTAPRFRIVGRSDDMVIVRGLNVFPVSVTSCLTQFKDLSGEYRITLKGIGPYDYLPLEVELTADAKPGSGLSERIEAELKKQTGARATVTLLPPLSLPRTAGKTKRVFREPA